MFAGAGEVFLSISLFIVVPVVGVFVVTQVLFRLDVVHGFCVILIFSPVSEMITVAIHQFTVTFHCERLSFDIMASHAFHCAPQSLVTSGRSDLI